MATASLSQANCRVALYVRVSTLGKGQDTEVQLRELRDYCGRRDWRIICEYIDAGISGTKEKRPSLDRLMSDAHRRRFDAVIVWKFDRFARSVSHLLRALETFRVLGVHFVSLSEAIDTSTPAGKMTFTVLGAVAELERSLIIERVKAGLRNAQANGKKLGRPKRILNEQRISALRAQGLGWKAIAADLGVGVGTVFGTLERVPKVRNTFLEHERGVSRNATGIVLDVSRQFDSLPLRPAAFIEPMECLAGSKLHDGPQWSTKLS